MSMQSKKMIANPDFVLRDADGEAVLIPVKENGILANDLILLNGTSRYLWQLFQEPQTVEDAIEKVKQEYADQSGEMEQDIRKFVQEFEGYGLLQER